MSTVEKPPVPSTLPIRYRFATSLGTYQDARSPPWRYVRAVRSPLFNTLTVQLHSLLIWLRCEHLIILGSILQHPHTRMRTRLGAKGARVRTLLEERNPTERARSPARICGSRARIPGGRTHKVTHPHPHFSGSSLSIVPLLSRSKAKNSDSLCGWGATSEAKRNTVNSNLILV